VSPSLCIELLTFCLLASLALLVLSRLLALDLLPLPFKLLALDRLFSADAPLGFFFVISECCTSARLYQKGDDRRQEGSKTAAI